ncbi:MAG: hypothetical protein AB9891_05805 [Anaerolineaceae bacterium]
MEETSRQSAVEPRFHLDEQTVQAKMESLKLEQNLALGILGGVLGGLIGAVAWALISYFTGYSIGWIAVGVGFLVGFGVSKLGKGLEPAFGIAGGVIALLSVLLGNFLVSLIYLAQYLEMGFLDVLLGFDYSLTIDLILETFAPMDLVFYAIAVYEGYRFSFRRVSREQLLEGAVTPG